MEAKSEALEHKKVAGHTEENVVVVVFEFKWDVTRCC